jgi:hypothetical protein
LTALRIKFDSSSSCIDAVKGIAHVLLKLFLILFFLINSKHQIHSQDTLNYPLNETKIEVGFTIGTFYFISDLEIATTISRRVSEGIVVEAKPLIGLIYQTFLFEGNESGYKLIYGGGTLGVNFGKGNTFFELTLGTGYFPNSKKVWSNSTPHLLPIGTIGYKKSGPKITFRAGVGFPQGVYLSYNF